MRRILNLMLVASVAASFMFAGSAFGQDKLDELYGKLGGSKPKISGSFGYAFGFWTITNIGNDANAEDVDGLVGMFESNLIFTGSNGPLDYRWRMRMRGRDRPDAFGDAGTLSDNKIQTLRGHVRWSPTKNLKIRIAKVAVTAVTSTTEVDPIQNLPCACFMADLFDKAQIDFQFTFGAHMVGFALAAETPGAMTTTGQVSGLAAGGATADSNNSSITGFIKLNFGAFKISGKVVTASGDNFESVPATIPDPIACALSGVPLEICTIQIPNPDPDAGTSTTENFSATGFTAHLAFSVGVGTAKFDIEQTDSDLSGGGTQTQLYTGASINLGGLNIGAGRGAREIEFGGVTSEVTQTNLSIHYRIPMGKGGWVGPEVQLQTKEADTVGGALVADEEITTVRWLHRIAF